MEPVPQSLTLSAEEAVSLLRREAEGLLAQGGRRVLGIAGGPGVGKSTLAMALCTAIGADAAYVPMDGFHRPHAALEAEGTAVDKGMPHTFDGEGFVRFLAALRAATVTMSGPGYSRRIEDVVPDAFTVDATARLLVVEGNYLLLARSPWWQVRPLLDRAIFLDIPRALVERRLMRRHAEEGLFTEARNRAHVARADLPNYDLVQRSRPRADIIIGLDTAD